MRNLVLSLVLILAPLAATGFETEDQIRLGPESAATTLRVISSRSAK